MTDRQHGETMTAWLRRRLAARSGVCPTCHQPTKEGGVRALAAEIGLPPTVVWRFLKGNDMTGRNLDKVVAWLDLTDD
jgi:hypothetical protein